MTAVDVKGSLVSCKLVRCRVEMRNNLTRIMKIREGLNQKKLTFSFQHTLTTSYTVSLSVINGNRRFENST